MLVCRLLLLISCLGLAACSGDEVTQAFAGGFKSWCRNADNCTVHEAGR